MLPPLRPAASGLFAFALVLASLARTSEAAETREQREAKARAACAEGRVDEGVEVLGGLYSKFGHPNYIYNQARCYQQNGRSEQAVARFREYQRAAPDISAEEKARIAGFIRELAPEPEAPAPASSNPAPKADSEPVADLAAPAPPRAPREPNDSADPAAPVNLAEPAVPSARRLRTAGYTLGVVAVAGGVVGLLSGLQVRSLSNEVEQAMPGQFTVEQLADQQDRAHRFEVLEGVGYGIGGAALVGAVICLVLDASDHRDDKAGLRRPTAKLLPTGGLFPSGGASFGLIGRF